MAQADNFMWLPGEDIFGETTDDSFRKLGAFEVFDFNIIVKNGTERSLRKKKKKKKDDEEDEDAPKKQEVATRSEVQVVKSVPGVFAQKLEQSGRFHWSRPYSISRAASIRDVSTPGAGNASIRSLASDSETEQKDAGDLKFENLEFEKYVDSASAPLYRACSEGTPIPTIMMAIRKAGGDPLRYLQYIFRDNRVTKISWKGGGDRARESFTISFKAMGMQYIQQKSDGSQEKPKSWSWNVVALGEEGKGAASLNFGRLPAAPEFLPGVDPDLKPSHQPTRFGRKP
jgi:type VI protein secretion system component Hcp